MTQPPEPVRLRDARSPEDSELARALREVSREAPSAAQLAAIVERASSELTQAQGGSSAVQGAVGGAKPVLVKVVALALLGGAALFGVRQAQQPTPTHEASATEASPAPYHPLSPAAPVAGGSAGVSAAAREATSIPAHADAATPTHAPGVPVVSELAERTEQATSPREPAATSAPEAAQPSRAVSVPSAAQRRTGSATAASAAGRAVAPAPAPSVRARVSTDTNAGVGSTAQVGSSTQATATPRKQTSAAEASEVELLTRAQDALARSPRNSIAWLDQHQSRYPHGEFAEERDALRIDALLRLGATSAMESSARRFLSRYPHSLHRDRIEHLLARDAGVH